ncbi:NAD(P)-binding domain-containing protein [Bacteroidota bacterium]
MNLGFIGTGKIAGAVVEGLCTSKAENLFINLSPRSVEISTQLANTFSNVYRLESNQAVVDKSDIIFAAFRPGISREVLSNLKFKDTHAIVSLIPSLSHTDLLEITKPAKNISRAIPLPTVVNHNSPIPVFNPSEKVLEMLNYIGQPIIMEDEKQLHTIWSLTGLIAPFFDLLSELKFWSVSKGVNAITASKYIVDMFQSISYMAKQTNPLVFDELVKQYATPGGMNEQARKEIGAKGVNEAYRIAAENLLKRFNKL